MKSPNEKFEVVPRDYTEIRMGSPLFGHIEVLGLDRQFGNREFGEAMAFSPDSRFLAISELVSAGGEGPISRVVVVDLLANREFVASPSVPGLIRCVSWQSEGTLSIIHWTHPFGETTFTWRSGTVLS